MSVRCVTEGSTKTQQKRVLEKRLTRFAEILASLVGDLTFYLCSRSINAKLTACMIKVVMEYIHE